MIIDEIVDYVITLIAFCVVFFRVVNHVIGTDSQDFISRLELAHVPADRSNCTGKVRSRAGVFRLTKSKDKSADTASQHATVEKSEGNRANADENLVVVRNRLFDVFNFQNV